MLHIEIYNYMQTHNALGWGGGGVRLETERGDGGDITFMINVSLKLCPGHNIHSRQIDRQIDRQIPLDSQWLYIHISQFVVCGLGKECVCVCVSVSVLLKNTQSSINTMPTRVQLNLSRFSTKVMSSKMRTKMYYWQHIEIKKKKYALGYEIM